MKTANAISIPTRTALASVALMMLMFLPANAVLGGEKELAVTSLPEKVRQSIDRAAEIYSTPLAGVRWDKVHELHGKQTIFQLEGVNARGNAVEMEVTKAGRIVEVEEHGISPGEVPDVVMDALNEQVMEFEPKKIEAIY